MANDTTETSESIEKEEKVGTLRRIGHKIKNFFLFPFTKIYKRYLWNKIKDADKPNHLAIILDGNRRYSKAHGLDIWAGHELGAKKVEEVLAYCWELGIKIVTLYAFSIENFNRPEDEVNRIMELAKEKFTELLDHPLIFKYKVRVRAIGRLNLLDSELREIIANVEEKTKDFQEYQLNIAIAYSGRAEIIDAIREILKDSSIDEIDEESFEKYLYTDGIPHPDLIVRTSGEIRLSGFLLWQSAYSELYFCDIYWPAVTKFDLWRAVRAFQKRHRRFGK